MPVAVSVAGLAHTVTLDDNPRLDATLATMRHAPKVLPMMQNSVDSEWDGTGAGALLHTPAARNALSTAWRPWSTIALRRVW